MCVCVLCVAILVFKYSVILRDCERYGRVTVARTEIIILLFYLRSLPRRENIPITLNVYDVMVVVFPILNEYYRLIR